MQTVSNSPWASFCVSTFQRPDFLKKQIACLLAQTFTDFEIVISDNDPAASGRETVQLFSDSRIRYEANSENLGMVKSFNRSVERSKGQYIVMITDNDPVYPDMLETLYELSQKYPGYGVYQGGCEILCYTPVSAKVMRGKVGLNSALSSNLDWGTVQVYSKDDFPKQFFNGSLGSLLLWSCGIVKRDILIKNGGMPDYGTEYFTDHAFNVVNGSAEGMVYINRSLGYQAIHGANFGFAQMHKLEKYKAIPDAFTQWIEGKLSHRADWPAIQPTMQVFTGRALVEFSLFIRKNLQESGKSLLEFEEAAKSVFKKPYLKKWYRKYRLMSRYPRLFQLAMSFKNR